MIQSQQIDSQDHRLTHQLVAEVERLQAEVGQLQQANQDLRIALATTAEHGDLIESQLHTTNTRLQAEVVERQRAEGTLQALLNIISRQRDDLTIIVETIMQHGDALDTQWYQKLAEATQLATLDGLTQIPNRRRFDQHLEQQWKQMVREQQPLSIILCDIDCFKQYNDAYGHLAGDDCLRQVANALVMVLKRPIDLMARYGGEEFGAVLPQTDEEGAVTIADQLQAAIAQLQICHPASSVSPFVTISIGVASTIPSHLRSSRWLVDDADQQLYLAKQQGRNRVVHHSIWD